MTSTDLLPAAVLRRKAVVYVRQSTQTQVQNNMESQRRQCDLLEEGVAAGLRRSSSSSRRLPTPDHGSLLSQHLGAASSGVSARPPPAIDSPQPRRSAPLIERPQNPVRVFDAAGPRTVRGRRRAESARVRTEPDHSSTSHLV